MYKNGIFSSFDLGGVVSDWRRAIELLDAASLEPQIDDTLTDALHTNHRASSAPVIKLREEPLRWEAPPEVIREGSLNSLRLYPNGTIAVRQQLDLRPGTPIASAYRLLDDFLSAKDVDYIPYVADAPSEQSLWWLDHVPARVQDRSSEVLGISDVLELRQILEPLIERRPSDASPRIYWHTYMRGAVMASAPTDRIAVLARDVACFKGEPQPESIPNAPASGFATPEGVRGHAWDDAVIAAWEGYDVLIVGEDEERLRTIASCAELTHQAAYYLRSWIAVLDEVELFDMDSAGLDDQAIRLLEQEILEMSSIEHKISSSTDGFENLYLMFRDPKLLQAAQLISEWFGTRELGTLLDTRLQVVDRYHSLLASVVDRNYQEAVRRQGEKLQLLFAGSVAAGITALIPATFAIEGESRTAITVATIAATVVLWTGIVLLARRWITVRIARRSGSPPRGNP